MFSLIDNHHSFLRPSYTLTSALEAILDRQVGRHVDTVESLRASIAQLREQAATPQAAAEAGWNDGMLKI